MQLAGARVWLTGASSGIGEALAVQLGRSGARVALTARREPDLEQIAQRITEQGGEALVVAADVADRESVHTAARQVEAAWGGLDLAFFNAGVFEHPNVFELDAAVFERQFQVNYFGVLYGVEAVLPGMLARRAGRIAATSSLGAKVPFLSAAAYGSSKAALSYTFNVLRFDLVRRGVGVTVVHPGFVRTAMTEQNGSAPPLSIGAQPAAAYIVRGLARDHDEINFPPAMALGVALGRRLPYRLVDRAMRFGAARGFR